MTNRSNRGYWVTLRRYNKIGLIVDAIRNMLQAHSDIDQKQTLLVYFNEFADSSLNIMVYCFTKTTVWQEWLCRTAGCLPENYCDCRTALI